MDSGALIAQLRAGDTGALGRFQTLYTPLIRYVISPILEQESDREECLSDVFLLVWRHIGQFDPARGSLTGWLTALARNAALNRRRDSRRHTAAQALSDRLPDSRAGPEELALRRERTEAVRRAVARLSPRDRELIYRKYYYYQSTAQMAAELGLSLRAVEGRLYRLRARLKRELGGEWDG